MQKILKIILALLAPLIQLSFLSPLPYLSHLNLVLILAILFLFYRSNFLITYILISGLILDVYSILPFPLITCLLALTVFLINLLFKNFFTNRSLYSLFFLGLIGTIIFNLALNLLNYHQQEINKIFFTNFFWQIVLNLLFLIIAWFLINSLSHKLKRTFFFKT